MASILRARRMAAGAMLAAALVAGVLVAGATPAGADPGGPSHFCDLFLPNDDGPVNDVIHHSLEPVVPALHYPLNCRLQSAFNDLGCRVTALAFLSGSSGFPPCFGYPPPIL